jgi:hypothetical protein
MRAVEQRRKTNTADDHSGPYTTQRSVTLHKRTTFLVLQKELVVPLKNRSIEEFRYNIISTFNGALCSTKNAQRASEYDLSGPANGAWCSTKLLEVLRNFW